MRKLLVIMCLSLLVAELDAQENNNRRTKNTLLKNSSLTGGFVGNTLKAGEMAGQNALWVGGEVGVIFGHDLGIGFAGYGLVNTVKSKNVTALDNPLYYQAGYGGVLIEPAMFENRIFSLSFPSLFGLGGVAETTFRGVLDAPDGFEIDHDFYANGSTFWVVEPGAQLNLNVTRWMKLNAGVTYRKTYGVDLPLISSSSLDGLQGTVSLKLGWF